MSSLSISQLEPIFTKMVNLVDEGIIIVDAQKDDLPIIYSNSGFSNITGYSAEEAEVKTKVSYRPRNKPESFRTI